MTWEQKIKDYLYPKLDNKLYKVEFKGMNDIYAGKDGMIDMAIWSIQRYLLQLGLFYGKEIADKVDVIKMIPKFVTKHFNNMSINITDEAGLLPLTFGQKSVGLSFNPSSDLKVEKAKLLLLAEAIDLLEEAHAERTSTC